MMQWQLPISIIIVRRGKQNLKSKFLTFKLLMFENNSANDPGVGTMLPVGLILTLLKVVVPVTVRPLLKVTSPVHVWASNKCMY